MEMIAQRHPGPMQSRAINKRYVGYLNQSNPEISFLGLDWFLRLLAQDLVRQLPGWAITQAIGQHPVERRGRGFIAGTICKGHGGTGQLDLYAAAIDLGLRDHGGTRYHFTSIDVCFVDRAKRWSPEAELAVANALRAMYTSLSPLFGGARQSFWSRISGEWQCGRALYPCPDFVG